MPIDPTFEEDHAAWRIPVIDPTPRIKLGFGIFIEANAIFGRHHAQQIPDLFLADTDRRAVLADITMGKRVTQPALGAADHVDALAGQPELFVELPIERDLRLFIRFDSALRKLPRILTNATCPQHLVAGVRDNDAYIRSETV